MQTSPASLPLLPLWRRRLPVQAFGSMVLVPLVNVFLLLLVFLMFGSSLVFQSGIAVEPPSVPEPSVSIADRLVVTLTSTGQLYFNDLCVNGWDGLESELAKIVNRSSRAPVIIVRADGRATHEDVVHILAIGRKYSARVFLVTKAEGPG